jgi:hypothetical protein
MVTALMTWNFTKDKVQTLLALFHDLGTPAFSHTIDYVMGDAVNQESSEKDVFKIISNSTQLVGYLKEDNIDINELKYIDKYTIVENKKPKLCVDRLDGVLHTCFIWFRYWDLSTVKKIYDDIIVIINEDGEKEIGFKSLDMAELFF